MANNIHLQNPPRSYNRFQPNQVLTDQQLNAMIDYFERQHRLSRSCLVGVGIVCGFDFQLTGNDAITIRAGLGITTDGDLLHMSEDQTYSIVSPFDDKAARYAPFWDKDEQLVPLWELVDGTQDEDREAFPLADLVNQENAISSLDNLVVIAYLDAFGKEGNICTPLDCNNQGIEQVAKLRFLLVLHEDVRKIIQTQDSIYFQRGMEAQAYFNLPKIRSPKVVINAPKSGSGTNLLRQYADTVADHRDELLDALQQLATDFKVLLDPNDEIDPLNWDEHFNQTFPRVVNNLAIRSNILYRYDHYSDLVQAYTELREALFRVLVICLPSHTAFPRHLMLGQLSPTVLGQDFDFRHSFYPSPAETTAHQQLLRVRSLYLRLHYMMLAYQDPDKLDELRITPSLENGKPIADQAIPFYYQPRAELLMHWDLEKYQRGQAAENLSYHAIDYAEDSATLHPLQYRHDELPFYRIEGHLGMTYGDAIDDLEKLREQHGLDFDIVALRVGAERTDLDLDEYDVFFQDLQMLMTAWRAEQICLLSSASNFFSGFSLKEPGTHIRYRGLQIAADQPGSRSLTGLSATTAFSGPTATFGQPAFMQPSLFQPPIMMSALSTAELQGPAVASLGATYSAGSTFTIEGTQGNSVFTLENTEKPQVELVEQSLEKDDQAIGVQVLEVLQFNKGREGATVRDTMVDRIQDYFKENEIDLEKYDPDDLDVTVNGPLELIARLQYLTEQQPNDLTDFTVKQIQLYRNALAELSAAVQVAKDKLQKVLEKTEREKRGFERDYLQMLNQLEMNVCSAKKMELLMEEFSNRKEQILKLTNFSEYVTQHPSMEHRAGVSRGGTFVMVYKDEASPKPIRPVFPFPGRRPEIKPGLISRPKYEVLQGVSKNINLSLSSQFAATRLADRSREIIQRQGLSEKKSSSKIQRQELRKNPVEFTDFVIDNHRLLNVEKTIKDYKLVTGISGRYRDLIKGAILEGIVNRGKIEPEVNVQQFTVIADFCLPYRCCSKLPPLTIALPRQRVQVQLPVGYLCVLEDGDPPARFPISVVPADGILRLDPDVADLLAKEDDKYFFEPSAITSELFGKTLKFLVNDQPTSAILKIYRKPIPGFSTEIAEPNVGRTVVNWTVQFKDQTVVKDGENLEYSWQFGDGGTSTEKAPSHTYSILTQQLKEDPQMKVSLTVTNGPCSNTQTEVITLPIGTIFEQDQACIEKGMEWIKTDQALVSKLLTGISIVGNRTLTELKDELESMYEILGSEKVQQLLFSGVQNAFWNDSHFTHMKKIDSLSNSSGERAKIMRQLALIVFRTYLVPLGCQAKLNSDEFDVSVIKNYRKVIKKIRNKEKDWFEGNDNSQPGVAFRQFFKEYLETAKFGDQTVKRLLGQILEVIE